MEWRRKGWNIAMTIGLDAVVSNGY